MTLSSASLRDVLKGGLPPTGDAMEVGKAVAARVCGWLEASRAGSEIEDVSNWAFNVELVLQSGDHWAIECLSPADFRMYPGCANIWVRDTNMSVDELVKTINEVAFPAGKKVSEHA